MPCFHCERAFEGVVMGPGLSEFTDQPLPVRVRHPLDDDGDPKFAARMCGRCRVVFFPAFEVGPGVFEHPSGELTKVMTSVRWALGRMVELRQAGEAARFRVTWTDIDGRRTYRLEIRRESGVIERPAWPFPIGGKNVVEEPP